MLPIPTINHLHRLLGGDAWMEQAVLDFIHDKYGVDNLAELPDRVAVQIIKRTQDFRRAVTKSVHSLLRGERQALP